MPKELDFSRYQEILHEDFKRVADEAGIDPARGQVFSAPSIYPFVLGASEPQKGTFVSRVVFGSSNPNLVPVPSIGVAKERTPDSPRVIYHVCHNGESHWFYPYADRNGEIQYFYSTLDDKVVEYLSALNYRKPDSKLALRKSIEYLKETGEVKDGMGAIAKRLFTGAGVDLKNLRYRAVWNGGVECEEIMFGTPKGFYTKDKGLVFVPSWNGKSTEECGWFVVTKQSSRQRVGPSEASRFLSSLS